MRIFKNRGDIFFSKTNKEKSTEQKILISALAFIVCFTIVFVTAISFKYDFSAKKFFAPDEVEEVVVQNDDYQLPEVEGKHNFIVFVKENDTLLFASMIQTDMDNVSYKVSTLKADTQCKDNKLSDILIKTTPENAAANVENLFNIEFDYYIVMEYTKFCDVFNKMGKINYTAVSDIKFRNNHSPSTYSLRIKEGEQKIDGKDAVSLIRYYLDEENNTSLANEIMLSSLSQHINKANVENSEELFQLLIANSQTNITVKDFSLAGDSLIVLSDERTAPSIYNALGEYKNNTLTDESIRSIKAYFVK